MTATVKTLLLALLGWVAIVGGCAGVGHLIDRANPDLRLTYIDVNDSRHSGDAAVLRLPDGDVWMIDAGSKQFYADRIKPWLNGNEIGRIHGFVLTHGHRNHFEGLLEMLADGVSVDTVYFTRTPDAICLTEHWPGGCRVEHINRLIVEIEKRGVDIKPLARGDVLISEDDVHLEVLYQFTAPVEGMNSLTVNDTSPVMRLNVGGTRVLFTGDIGRSVGAWLAEQGEGLEADILHIPHHGLATTAPDAFFNRVQPEIALVNGPAELWQSKRGEQARNWASVNRVETYVAGVVGNIEISFEGERYTITTER